MDVAQSGLPRQAGASVRRQSRRPAVDRAFYTTMTLAAAVAVVVGFAPTFFLRSRYIDTGLSRYLQIHGVLFTTWIALFIVQNVLVAAGRTDIHRRLGWIGAALAALMLAAGTAFGGRDKKTLFGIVFYGTWGTPSARNRVICDSHDRAGLYGTGEVSARLAPSDGGRSRDSRAGTLRTQTPLKDSRVGFARRNEAGPR